MRRTFTVLTVAALGAALGACANDSTNFLTTSAVTPPPAAVTKPIAEPAAVPVDPSCAPLAARIDQLRQDQAVANLEKASLGKTRTVAVKRKSLAQQAELNKANFEFQSKCMGPGKRTAPVQAQAAKPATVAAAAPARKP
ncbi:MAG: hypothetical protein R3D27_00465 [Hyphomicrobiaceae bacterium]